MIRAIPHDSVLIEFARISPYETTASRTRQRPARYAAWILSPDRSNPLAVVDLGLTSTVDATLRASILAIQNGAERSRQEGEAIATESAHQLLKQLSDRVLKPLLPHLNGVERLILAPDAALWLIPWAALPLDENRFAVEEFEFRFVVCGRDLAKSPARPNQRIQAPVILANPNYDLFGRAGSQVKSEDLSRRPVSRLPGTAAEAARIQPSLTRHSSAATYYEKSWRMALEVLEPGHEHTMRAVNGLAAAAEKAGLFGLACEATAAKLKQLLATKETDDADTLTCRLKLARLLESADRHDEAEKVFLECIVERQCLYGERTAQSALAHSYYGQFQERQGLLIKAAAELRLAADIREETVPEKQSLLRSSWIRLRRIYGKLNDQDQEAKYAALVKQIAKPPKKKSTTAGSKSTPKTQMKPADVDEDLLAMRDAALSSMNRVVQTYPVSTESEINPLLRCGLLLTGCNNRQESLRRSSDDGVLTGLEIVGIDLQGTRLVVLSACETGVGEIRSGEGVAGLRQAFQLAGAESVVASLWSIPDEETSLLMDAFFSNLADGKDKSTALRQAQLARIKARRERFGAAHPFVWAAFTLTGQQ